LDEALTGLVRSPKIVSLRRKKALMKVLNHWSEHDRNFALIMGLTAFDLMAANVKFGESLLEKKLMKVR